MWGALAEYRSVTSDINISILASRLRALFAFMTPPFSPRSICRQPASLLRFEPPTPAPAVGAWPSDLLCSPPRPNFSLDCAHGTIDQPGVRSRSDGTAE